MNSGNNSTANGTNRLIIPSRQNPTYGSKNSSP